MKTRSLICSIILISSALILHAAPSVWLSNLPIALDLAKKENKKVLLNFTGSDWCSWCMKLQQEVFSRPEFKAYAEETLVLVELDFPQRNTQRLELIAANKALAKKFGVTGYPTIFIVDSDGNTLLRTSYLAGGATNYIAHLERKLNPTQLLPVTPPPPEEAPAPAPPPKIFTGPILPAPVIRYDELTLKGIMGTKNRRFALINNQTLGIGEKAKVKLGDGQVEVLCQEIRDDSVLIKVENETEPKELSLKEN